MLAEFSDCTVSEPSIFKPNEKRTSIGLGQFIVVVVSILLNGLVVSSSLAADDRGPMVLSPEFDELAAIPFSKSYALVVGIDNYEDHAWDKLDMAVDDAREVAKALEARGYEVTTLIDGEATYHNLLDAIRDLVDGPGKDPNARLLLWFAGHGYSADNREYIVPVDAGAPESGTVFTRRALRLSVLRTLFEDVRARHLLAVFDSCFSGDIHKKTRGAQVSKVVTTANNNVARQLLSSGVAGQKVFDDGKFRELFLAAIEGDADSAGGQPDGYVTAEELVNFLKYELGKYGGRKGSSQTPVLSILQSDGSGGSFVFRTRREQAVNKEAQSVPVGPTAEVALNSEAPRHECDRLAESSDDQDFSRVIPACLQAAKDHPDSARFAYKLGQSYYLDDKFDEAIEWYTRAAEKHHVEAMADLGRLFFNMLGFGPQKFTSRQAVDWLRKAVMRGHIGAMEGLAYILGTGTEDVPQDQEEAFRWFTVAAVNGSPTAMMNLASMNFQGEGVPANPKEGIRWVRKAAEFGLWPAIDNLDQLLQEHEGESLSAEERFRLIENAATVDGSVQSVLDLANHHQQGIGTPKDFQQALHWYRELGEDEEALNAIGLMYLFDDGEEQDAQKALEYFHQSASLGQPQGMYNIAQMYLNAKGVELDEAEGLRWLKKVAELEISVFDNAFKNDPSDAELVTHAKYMMGELVAAGRGTVADEVEANNWYRKAAEAGNTNAMVSLHNFYVASDPEEAAVWLLKAAEAGEVEAMVNMALRFHVGDGVEISHTAASDWMKKAQETLSGQGLYSGPVDGEVTEENVDLILSVLAQ